MIDHYSHQTEDFDLRNLLSPYGYKPKVKKEYLALVAELNKHNDLYHNQDSLEISDQEYDQLLRNYLL